MSEGTGWAGRLRRVLNARMEEMSFRSGVAVFAGVLALTAVGIALTVTLGAGHPAAATSASVTRSPMVPPSSASAAPSSSDRPSATQDAPQSAPVPTNEDAPQP